MSTTKVAPAEDTTAPAEEGTTTAPAQESTEGEALKQFPESGFDWDKTLQGNLLGAFFYGYLVFQLPGGMMAETFGAKAVVTAGMLPVAILTLVTPVLTEIHYIILFVIRVIVGMGQSVMYPAVTALWAKWSPPMERSLLVGISLSGGQFGNAFILPVGGLLCAYVSWQSVFYVVGACGFLFCLLWMAWVHPSPAQHKGLSKQERTYLERTIPTVAEKDKPAGTPWKAIFTSLPVWAIIAAHTLGNYTYYMIMTQMPTYMKEVLKFNIKANGAFSMLPYLVFWLSMIGAGALSDCLIRHKVSMLVVRKTFAMLGLLGPAAFMILTAYMDCTRKYYAVFTLCCAVGMTGFGFASYLVNHGDLAPDYAGTLFGITNTLATLPGFVAPVIVGAMTPNGTVDEWRRTFFVAAGINGTGALIYLLLARASIQPWSAAKEGVVVKNVKLSDSEAELHKVKALYTQGAEVKRKISTMRRMSTILHP
ncbi:sialin-like [Babylonia areolata]|uniref:sialin-like n=1 Tax=Babylonia areolata TaxID=304850 RepID=UPI003FD33DFE